METRLRTDIRKAYELCKIHMPDSHELHRLLDTLSEPPDHRYQEYDIDNPPKFRDHGEEVRWFMTAIELEKKKNRALEQERQRNKAKPE